MNFHYSLGSNYPLETKASQILDNIPKCLLIVIPYLSEGVISLIYWIDQNWFKEILKGEKIYTGGQTLISKITSNQI